MSPSSGPACFHRKAPHGGWKRSTRHSTSADSRAFQIAAMCCSAPHAFAEREPYVRRFHHRRTKANAKEHRAMKRLCAALMALAMSGGLVLAQSSGGTGGSGASGGVGGSGGPGAGSSGPGTGAPGTPPGSTYAPPGTFNPNTMPNPGATTPGSGGATTGRGPNPNPANPQDMTGRSNPQDQTSPRTTSPRDPGLGPQITVPER
jgi:hypothetical protein